MNIFSGRVIQGLSLFPKRTVAIAWSDGTGSINNSVTYVVTKDKDIYDENGALLESVNSGMIHLYQNGAANSMGFFGHWVSNTTPLIIDGISYTSIVDVSLKLTSDFI